MRADTFREATAVLSGGLHQAQREYSFLYREMRGVVNHLLFVHRDNLLLPTLVEENAHDFDHTVNAQQYQTHLRNFQRTHGADDVLLPLTFFSGTSFVFFNVSACARLCPCAVCVYARHRMCARFFESDFRTTANGARADETNLTSFQLRSANAAVYPLYLSTPMLGREKVRSRHALEVLALLPRYEPKLHGGDDTHEDEHTTNRRLLLWRVLYPILAPLIPGSQAWDPGEPAEDEDTHDENEEYAYVGEQIIFGEMRHVYVVPLLYIAGVPCVCMCVCVCVCMCVCA